MEDAMTSVNWLIVLVCLNIILSAFALVAVNIAIDDIRRVSKKADDMDGFYVSTRRLIMQHFDHTKAHLQAILDGQSAASSGDREAVKLCLHDIQDRAAKYLRSLPSKES